MRPARFVFAAALAALAPLSPRGAAAQEVSPLCTGEVVAVGRGAVTAAPDLLAVEFSVETREETPAAAFAGAAERVRAVIDALLAGGVSEADVATSGLSLGPVYGKPARETPAEVTGWRAFASLSVKVRELDAFGRLASAAVEAGANGLSSARLEVSDAEARRGEARAAAVRDAMDRAAGMAEAAGLRLGPVLSLSEAGAPPDPRPFGARAAAMAESADMPIAPGERTLEAQVRLTAALCPEGAPE